MNSYNEFTCTDGIISLFRNKTISENENLSLSQAECFDIISNDTNKLVGVISYRFNEDPNYIDYTGNINYRIKEEYRGLGYASRSLNLMLEVLKNNTKFDNPLYVSSTTYNDNYLKVAKECGGELIHSGLVPKSVIDSFYDREMRYVEVYKFDIKKLKERKTK